MGTRPILDRVKGSLFDWLGSRLALPGHLPAVNVCDIFCGGGSQGIEALSRGASFCAFVEIDPVAVKCLKANLATIQLTSGFAVVSRPAETVSLRTPDDRGFSIVFLDPPFGLSENVSPGTVMGRLIERIGNQIPTEPDALVLWRHDQACKLPKSLPSGWVTTDVRSWGTNAITMFERPRAEARP